MARRDLGQGGIIGHHLSVSVSSSLGLLNTSQTFHHALVFYPGPPRPGRRNAEILICPCSSTIKLDGLSHVKLGLRGSYSRVHEDSIENIGFYRKTRKGSPIYKLKV